MFAILKLSALATVSKEASSLSVELYKDCYAHAEKTNQVRNIYEKMHLIRFQFMLIYWKLLSLQVTRVNDFFLTQLGLIKSEDKTFKPAYDISSCRFGLQQAIEANAFSDSIRAMYSVFLG